MEATVISKQIATHETTPRLFMNAPLLAAAERELAAFLETIGELIGPEFVDLAAELWIKGLSCTKEPCEVKEAFWRRVTISACARLSDFVIASTSGVPEYSSQMLRASYL
jgi:hypothetical protein